jgi:pimeloyl-ACP methyl ester carboxylesterase
MRSRQRLASFSRVVTFDRRGTGLSDALNSPPTLDQQMDDLIDAGARRRAVA